MICPYCSADMEPIELNGKTFCSNCGLTINSSQPSTQVQPSIRPIHEVEAPEDLGTNQNINIRANAEVPVVNEFENLTVPEPKDDLPPLEDIHFAEKPGEPEPVETNPTVAQVNEAIQDFEPTKTQEVSEPQIVSSAPKENAIETTEQNQQSNTDFQPDLSLTEAVKNVDALGASGILLDILNDDAVSKEEETAQKALEAAKELVEKIEVVDKNNPEDGTKMQTFVPPNATKLKINVLDNSPVNPIKHPEIEPAEEELEIEAPKADENVQELTDYFKQNEEAEPEEAISEQSQANTSGDPVAEGDPTRQEPPARDTNIDENGAEIVPDVTPEEEKIIAKDVADIFQGSEENSFEDLPSLKSKKKHKTPKLIKEAAEELKEEEEKDTPFVPEEIKTENSAITAPPLKDYFNHFLKPVETPKKKKKAKKVKQKRVLISVLITVLILTFISFFAYVYVNYVKNQENTSVEQTQETVSTNANLPTEVVVAYNTAGDPEYDEVTKTYTQEYVFTGDKSRTITFTQTESSDVKSLYDEELGSTGQGFQTKTENGTEYSQLTDGSVYWTKDNYFYKLTVKGDTYKDLVYKMALSVGDKNER